MARNFGNLATNYLLLQQAGTNKKPVLFSRNGFYVSGSIWFRPDGVGQRQDFISLAHPSNTPTCLFAISSGAHNLAIYSNSGFATGPVVPLNVGVWVQVGFSWYLNGTVKFYINGQLRGTAVRTLGGTDTVGMALGTANPAVGTARCNGALAESALWVSDLDGGDWAALGRGVSPLLVRRNTLVSHVGLNTPGSSERDSVTGWQWNVNGTLPVVAHPPVARVDVWRPAWRVPTASAFKAGWARGCNALVMSGRAA